MAENDKNLPKQEPDNLENKIDNPEVVNESVEAVEGAEQPVDQQTDEQLQAAADEPAVDDAQSGEEDISEPEDASVVAAQDEEMAEEPADQNGSGEEQQIEESSIVEDEASESDDVGVESAEAVVSAVDEESALATSDESDESDELEAPVDEADEPIGEADEESEDEDEIELDVDDGGSISLKHSEREEFFADSDNVDPADLIIYDEVVAAIKAEGERLEHDDESIKSYVKHSKDAVRNFEAALKAAQRAYQNNRNEQETPATLAAVIKICGKLLEVKCNNLENFVRVKAYNYYKEARTALHLEIDRYNDYVITYASITGEQLTRLSTFLPESICSGKCLGVIPELVYNESFVQVLPDEEKTREDNVTTTVIDPPVSAKNLLAEIKEPSTRGACGSYGRKINRAMKKLNAETVSLNKVMAETKLLRKRYESELATIEKRTPLAQQATDEYKSRVFEINIKYGKQLSGIETVKAKSAFARVGVKLAVNRLVLEREKLVLAYEYMRNAYRIGTYSHRKAAEKLLSKAIVDYNKCAELCAKATGTVFDQLPKSLIEQTCRGKEIVFPTVAYKRELVEKVGDNVRAISMVVLQEISPDEEGYAESTGKILDGNEKIRNMSTLSAESAAADRASAIAKVMIESLKESAEMVISADEYEQFEIKSRKAVRFFKRSLRKTERSIARAFDENGVITALVENLRVIANLIEVRRIHIAVAVRLKRGDQVRGLSRSLYKNIELYNGRAIDYMSIVGEQFSRITLSPTKDIPKTAETLKVPTITYKDNYIEVFPKDPLDDSTYEKPRQWRSGIYTPLLMHHYRLTENRAVETTVINAPFVFDIMVDELPAVSWHHPIGLWEHLTVWAQPIGAWLNRFWTNIDIWFVDESLIFSRSGLRGRQKRNDKKQKAFERKIKALNEEHKAKILALETVVHETDRHGLEYQKKLYKINSKYERKIYNLKVRFMRECTGLNEARLQLERLVLDREHLTGINKVLIKYRSYGRITFTRNVLVRYKKKFVEAIVAHNNTARKLSEMIGVKFAEVSTSVADEIIRYGNMIKFPEIVCCREVIETVDGKQRTIGDRWHGYGLYTGTSGSAAANGAAPIMSVGAMGYATDMGVPFLKADFEGMTIMGMTPGGVPLIGFNPTGETLIPFTGTPMMLSGADSSVVLDASHQESLILGAANVTDPYSGINRRGVDARYTDDVEEDAKDLHSGIEVETPLDIQTKMIEERFVRALRARSMTSVDNVLNWWKLVFSEINVMWMRSFIFLFRDSFVTLLPPKDGYLEIVNTKVKRRDENLLREIAKIGGLIDIETKKLYSATKTGVRRSQRVWSAWLHDDIQYYNELVTRYNKGDKNKKGDKDSKAKPRYDHIELLSLTIPDTIIFRKEERPPAPPVFSLRNRVKFEEDKAPIRTEQIYDKLVDYAIGSATRHACFISRLWAKVFTIPSLERARRKGKRLKALRKAASIINRRVGRTYKKRGRNEFRHYRIRYEKARAMRRYNRRTLRAIGVANDPIKYQSRVHNVLRKYLRANFRIDYNMRIRQLIYRCLKINVKNYLFAVLGSLVLAAFAVIFAEIKPVSQVLIFVMLVSIASPIYSILLRIVYEIVMFIVNFFLTITRNIVLIRYGARDVERNRYGAVLDCFVAEQYRLLLACEKVRMNPSNIRLRRTLIALVNEYNKKTEVFSEILRIPIKQIETSSLLEKLTTEGSHQLNELQNFVYVRELVERVDRHQRGKTLKKRELDVLVDEINKIINGINIAGSEDQVAVDFLQGSMHRLISHIQTGIKPTQTERYEMKRDLIEGIQPFAIDDGDKELFARNVMKIVDQIGGRDSRKIIGVLAKDNMIGYEQ